MNVKTVYLWQNDLAMAVDTNDQLITHLQGRVYDPKRAVDIVDQLIDAACERTVWKVGNWNNGNCESMPRAAWVYRARRRQSQLKEKAEGKSNA